MEPGEKALAQMQPLALEEGSPACKEPLPLWSNFAEDIGEQVRVADLAREYIRLSGSAESNIRIEFTGLGSSADLDEKPLTNGEHSLTTPHHKLRIAKSLPALDSAWIDGLFVWLRQGHLGSEQIGQEPEKTIGMANAGSSISMSGVAPSPQAIGQYPD